MLKYCINPKHFSLFHNILADVVEVCGGSRLLLKILNKFGCVCSADTHDRFVTERAEEKRNASIWDELSSNVFTVASVDNFDMLQSHAAVFCGNQQRSYHGTTVQLVQPDHQIVLTNTACSDDLSLQTQSHQLSKVADTYLVTDTISCATQVSTAASSTQVQFDTTGCNEREQPVATEGPTPRSIVIGRTRNRHSPASSPHKMGKRGPKRRRTVPARKLTSFRDLQEQARESSHSLNLDAFKETVREKQILTEVMRNLHTYNTQKIVANSHTNVILSDFRTFLTDPQQDLANEASRVYYMELVDENPDSAETMKLVAEDLIDKFGTQTNGGGWIVLVGDGKTYQHLMQVKRQYGATLERLLIFPGDWHTLKNYQETIMKVYYSAGLKDIAKKSGYQGTTLLSLEKCSNFKRTHNFLLQVWEALYRVMLLTFSQQSQEFHSMFLTIDCILSAAISEKNNPRCNPEKISRVIRRW